MARKRTEAERKARAKDIADIRGNRVRLVYIPGTDYSVEATEDETDGEVIERAIAAEMELRFTPCANPDWAEYD